ncbi:MAG: HAD family phosphatase [Verrucomicrobia bacterium]|jgi:HAD superfamily hydrolase (TIGR01509 family)|nr:HAD family phosphatase [Verrucomicrobiota bacterium]
MKPAAAVIFDMDGVLVDSEAHHERAFLDTVAALGYRDRHGLTHADYLGRSDREMWQDFIARNHAPYSLDTLRALKCDRVVAILRRERPLFPGAFELVENLAVQYPLALASGSERPVVDTVLQLRGIGRFFRVTLSAAEVERGKPAPDTFLRAAEQLAVAPEDCWVIEDSKPGIVAALAAGMKVIAITNTHPADELTAATHVVRDYAAIEQILLPPSGPVPQPTIGAPKDDSVR